MPDETTATRPLLGLASPGRAIALTVIATLFGGMLLAAWWSGTL